ncbi:hypothetical protein J5N97_009338 [Dioscorea zingiberensis]|uniref:beta-ketoacyl-[acyl-carrier-protein] synthase I n=1 Tax=Dioscorea zingiberensis TaxID=325984 RepID=A0A9D5CZ75_9LILI|nr:hypothetical protein J5N97_009338 [Dioscorea zingiberensis]
MDEVVGEDKWGVVGEVEEGGGVEGFEGVVHGFYLGFLCVCDPRLGELLGACDAFYNSSRNGSVFFGDSAFSLFGTRNSDDTQRQRRRANPYSGKAMALAVTPLKEVTEKKKPHTKQRRVVVTGMVVVTPLGHDPDVFYNNLLEGVSGISEIEAF